MPPVAYRVITLDETGKLRQTDYPSLASLLDVYEQTGVEEDSYTMRLRGEPVLRGMVGPLSDGKTIVRYESAAAYVILTREWAKRRNNRQPPPVGNADGNVSEEDAPNDESASENRSIHGAENGAEKHGESRRRPSARPRLK